MYSVYAQVAVDPNDNNDGTNPMVGKPTSYGLLRFGGLASGEAIGSNRSASNLNRYGIDFYTGYYRRMILSAGGNLGIGISGMPTQRLHINGSFHIDPDPSVANTGEIRSNTNLVFRSDADNSGDSRIRFYNGSTEILSLAENKYIGIGVINPSSRLQVLGSIHLDPDPAVSNSGEIRSNTYLVFHPDADGLFGDSKIKFLSGGTNPTERVTIDESGKMGINQPSPQSKLHVSGVIQTHGEVNAPDKTKNGLTFGSNTNYNWIQSKINFPLLLNPVSDGLTQDPNSIAKTKSYVGIGFSSDSYSVPLGYTLAVKGKIISEGIKIMNITSWADYVFDSNYKLMKLSDVENFVKTNKHLPDIPSEKEVKENGLDAENMQMLLLKKIEELTLYVIEQEKKIIEQNKKIKTLENTLTK